MYHKPFGERVRPVPSILGSLLSVSEGPGPYTALPQTLIAGVKSGQGPRDGEREKDECVECCMRVRRRVHGDERIEEKRVGDKRCDGMDRENGEGGKSTAEGKVGKVVQF